MKTLVAFIGHPAGGKTSASYTLSDKLDNSLVIEIDEIKTKISGSVFAKDDEERELWFTEINKQIKEAFNTFETVIIDEGFFTNELFKKITIGLEDIRKIVVEISYDIDEHLQRNENRGDIPEPVLRMFEVWNSVPQDEKIKPNLVINDINLKPEEIADKVAQLL
jgi:predicted kinase